MIGKDRETSHPEKWKYVCSNHFRDSETTRKYPNPSLTLTRYDELQAILKRRRSLAKRRAQL